MITCSQVVSPPANGAVSTGPGTALSVLDFSCNQGYTLQGSQTTICQLNGTWSSGTPTCKRMYYWVPFQVEFFQCNYRYDDIPFPRASPSNQGKVLDYSAGNGKPTPTRCVHILLVSMLWVYYPVLGLCDVSAPLSGRISLNSTGVVKCSQAKEQQGFIRLLFS